MLGRKGRRQSQLSAHGLGRAIVAIEPGAFVGDAVTSRGSRIDRVSRSDRDWLGLGRCTGFSSIAEHLIDRAAAGKPKACGQHTWEKQP